MQLLGRDAQSGQLLQKESQEYNLLCTRLPLAILAMATFEVIRCCRRCHGAKQVVKEVRRDTNKVKRGWTGHHEVFVYLGMVMCQKGLKTTDP